MPGESLKQQRRHLARAGHSLSCLIHHLTEHVSVSGKIVSPIVLWVVDWDLLMLAEVCHELEDKGCFLVSKQVLQDPHPAEKKNLFCVMSLDMALWRGTASSLHIIHHYHQRWAS